MVIPFALLISSFLPLAIANYASTPIHDLKAGSSPDLTRRQNLHKRDVDPTTLYPAYNISVPIDHFQNESMYEPHLDGTFELRYWFDATYYKDGGPVIVLHGGETSGEDRLPYLQKGIVYQLAEATNGLGVILEHRYYGTSFPTPDLATENLRFLTTQQALADAAYFAQNVVFEGFEDKKLTAPNTPYIAYGGSYAGAFTAFLRVQYPDVYFGMVASLNCVLSVRVDMICRWNIVVRCDEGHLRFLGILLSCGRVRATCLHSGYATTHEYCR